MSNEHLYTVDGEGDADGDPRALRRHTGLAGALPGAARMADLGGTDQAAEPAVRHRAQEAEGREMNILMKLFRRAVVVRTAEIARARMLGLHGDGRTVVVAVGRGPC